MGVDSAAELIKIALPACDNFFSAYPLILSWTASSIALVNTCFITPKSMKGTQVFAE
ncbi:hypothetical protein Syun_016696 [Stephania yunnanensis]|uniref:Uncharacterized protein n=1 Tax=Stephania yunnanensis TaxID=152371 RepID=A0AAP0P2P4_9MAGN